MAIHPLRKLLWKTGFDVRRYRPEPDQLLWLKEIGIQTIVDVGANIGQFAQDIRSALPDAYIYSFEPLKDCYDDLLIAMKNDKKFKAFNVALGALSEEVTMHRNDYSASSSILDMAQSHKDLYPYTKNTHDEKIVVRRLDDMRELHPDNLKKEILIKIDTQGYEDRVIRGGIEFLKNTKVIIIETSFITLYEEQLLFAEIYKMLTLLGFVYKGSLRRKFNLKNGGNLYEDSIFVHKSE
ncbi:MAG: FkbM family methyltransferase [Candidatus Sungbacteria bacterium]|nr:FkbM family methyltransferase [Candidatus Sungbacteria bacterium]